MRVYRICNNIEYEIITNTKRFNKIGNQCQKDKRINTHNYLKNANYMHFFKSKESIFYLNLDDNNYLCIYDIPDNILEDGKGFGYYYDVFDDRKYEKVCEYALKSDLIDYSYLERIELLEEVISLEDFLFRGIWNTKIIYDKNNDELDKAPILKLKK